jgi:hypothetical protein
MTEKDREFLEMLDWIDRRSGGWRPGDIVHNTKDGKTYIVLGFSYLDDPPEWAVVLRKRKSRTGMEELPLIHHSWLKKAP